MPRPQRIHHPGAFFHVVHRGVERRTIFFGPSDYDHYAALLSQGVLRYGHKVHAFCLMPNHAHLFIEVDEVPLSRAMQNLSFRYAQWINRRRGRVGHLFQGRYKAHYVAHDRYATAVLRYVHRNPVRAGLAREPGEWPWSSHGEYMGRRMYPWVASSFLLSILDPEVSEQRRAYLDLVMPDGHDGSPDEWLKAAPRREAAPTPPPVGPMPSGLTPERVVPAVERVFGVTAEQLAARTRGEPVATARAVLAHLCVDHGSVGPSALSRMFGFDPTAWVQAGRRLRRRIASDRLLADAVRRVAEAAVPEADELVSLSGSDPSSAAGRTRS